MQNRDWSEIYQFHVQLPRTTEEQVAIANNYMAKAGPLRHFGHHTRTAV